MLSPFWVAEYGKLPFPLLWSTNAVLNTSRAGKLTISTNLEETTEELSKVIIKYIAFQWINIFCDSPKNN